MNYIYENLKLINEAFGINSYEKLTDEQIIQCKTLAYKDRSWWNWEWRKKGNFKCCHIIECDDVSDISNEKVEYTDNLEELVDKF